MKKITVKRAAELLGKGELFVRECIKDGSLPIGTATKLPNSERWNFSISPKALADYLGCPVNELYEEKCKEERTGECLFTEEQIRLLCATFERVLRGVQVKDMEELDVAADRAGGYVSPPWDLEENPEGLRKFSAIRQYALENNKPISQFTEEDYRKIGIEPLR